MWSVHSRRSVPTRRSAIAFAVGAALAYATSLLGVSEDVASRLTERDLSTWLASDQGSLFDAVEAMFAERFGAEAHVEKVGFAREVVTILAATDVSISETAHATIEGNFGLLLADLAGRLLVEDVIAATEDSDRGAATNAFPPRSSCATFHSLKTSRSRSSASQTSARASSRSSTKSDSRIKIGPPTDTTRSVAGDLPDVGVAPPRCPDPQQAPQPSLRRAWLLHRLNGRRRTPLRCIQRTLNRGCHDRGTTDRPAARIG